MIITDRVPFDVRFIPEYRKLKRYIDGCKEIGLKIVLTSGSFDMLHIGHAEYLAKAKEFGNILVVGVDSDDKIRKRKGPDRPVVNQDERLRMLAHLRCVDTVTLKEASHPRHHLIRTVRPDILIISDTTGHTKADIAAMKKYCKKVVKLPPQAETSTTAKIRLLFTSGTEKFADQLSKELPDVIRRIQQRVLGGGEG
jgi:rfaE bifunctional protein nucleotidyltransferase chain/domain